MKKGKKIIALLLALALLVVTLAACGSGTNTSGGSSANAGSTAGESSTPESSGTDESSDASLTLDTDGEVYDTTITMSVASGWDSLMPYYTGSSSMQSREILNFIYDRLVYTTAGGTELIPLNAASWESAEDGYSIVFTLNPDSKWHDGEPVTAADWVFTLELISDPDAYGAGISGGVSNLLTGTDDSGALLDGQELGAEAVDDHTLKLTFKDRWTPEDFLLRYNRDFSVLPRHLLEGIPVAELLDNDFWSAPVGSGPLIFDHELIDSEIYLKANRDYEYPVNGFGTLKVVVMDSSNVLQARISGDVDLPVKFTGASTDDIAVAESAGFEIVPNEYGTMFVELILNNDSLDTNLRLAMYYALDRETGVEVGAQGQGYVVDTYVPSYSEYCNTSLVRQRDVEKAKELVAQSDYDGRTLQLACAASRVELMSLFQQNLEEAGIHVEIINVDVATMFAGLTDGSYDIGVSGHTATPYPLWFANTVLASNYGDTYYSVSDPTYEEIYNQILAEVDETRKHELIDQFQEYIFNNVPWIPLYYSNEPYIASKTVTGVDYDGGSFCNENVWEWVKAAG